MSRLLALAKRGDVAQLKAEAMQIAREAGMGLMGTGSPAWARLWNECNHHLQFRHSPSNEKLEPLVEAFVKSLPKPEATLRLKALRRQRQTCADQIEELTRQLAEIERQMRTVECYDLFTQVSA